MGNSIVSGLSTKSNAQNEKAATQRGQQAYEQAIAAGIPETQAKLLAAKEVLASVSPGKRPQVDINETDDALSVSYLRADKSKGGITLTNSNSLTAIGGLTSWISDEGLWGNNDVVKLATGLLDRRSVATQYMIDQATHDINYYTMSKSSGGHKINGSSRQGAFIPWRPDLMPQSPKFQSPLERFNRGQHTTPGPWADGYVIKAPTQQTAFERAIERYASFSMQDVTPLLAGQSLVSNALFAKSLYDTARNGIMAHTKPAATMFTLGNNLVTLDGTQRPGFNPDQVPINSRNVVQGLSATGVLVNALRSGAGVGAVLAPIGTAIEYSIQGKPILSEAFAKDAGVDMIKGGVSGAIGGAATTAVIAGAVIFAGTVAAPVVAGAVIIGFATSWAFGEYVFDPVVGDDLKKWWKD